MGYLIACGAALAWAVANIGAVLPADRELAVKTDIARVIDLEPLATAGDSRVIEVSDADPTLGGAAANPITITPNGAEKINGVAASVVINWNGGALTLKADVSLGTWRIIGGCLPLLA